MPTPSSHDRAKDPDPDRDRDAPNDDDYDETPLQNKRPFGSGLHKKPVIAFVPASSENSESLPDSNNNEPEKPFNISEWYLAFVCKKPSSSTDEPSPGTSIASPAAEDQKEGGSQTEMCEVCKIPFPTSGKIAHITSISHQVRLPHSHPPSSLDRSRMGVSVLSDQGWDPDSRKGLGSSQQGIAYPLKPKPKDDKLGIGAMAPAKGKQNHLLSTNSGGRKGETPKKILGAGRMRRLYKEEKRRTARIHHELFGDDKLEKYLGKGTFGKPTAPGHGIDFSAFKKKN